MARPRLLAAALVVLVLAAGCGSQLSVDSYPTEPDTSLSCKSLLADRPLVVADADARRVKDGNAAAWGDPAIILRCGVEKPAELGPASRCDMVGDIGWFTESTSDGLLFTTIGREFYISVEVPHEYEPEADALADLADLVARHDPVKQACV